MNTSTANTAKKIEIKGSVEYRTMRIDECSDNTVKVRAIWTVPSFMDLINNTDITEIHSPPYKRPQKFRFAMGFDKGTKHIRIYYRSLTQVFLKSIRLKSFTFDETNWVFSKHETSIAKEHRRIVQANEWQRLTHLIINKSKGLCLQDNRIITLLKNGSIRLKFEFVVTINEIKEDQFYIPATQLSNDFENLFQAGMFSDVVMKSADGEEFRVHKAILASRSVVLRANFEHNTTESITNIVESPLEAKVLHEMLTFIYTDKSPKVDDFPEKLLAAADYYQLSRLKTFCEDALHRKLSVDNAIDILQLADLHSANTLKQLTLEFIKQDYGQMKLITKTNGWAKLQSVDLIKRICE